MEKYSIEGQKRNPVVVGFDVHKDTISACVFDPASGEICHELTFKNESVSLRRFIRRVRQRFGEPRVVTKPLPAALSCIGSYAHSISAAR
jgi:hypothetical protein